MLQGSFISAVALTIGFLGTPAIVQASDSVSSYLAEYLVGKLLDEVFDSVTGKPDTRLLDQRLKELENNAVMRGKMREEIRKLRESINDRVTREEFQKMAKQVASEIGSIKRRLDELEEQVEKLEVENEDFKNGTKNATDAKVFVTRGDRCAKEQNYQRAPANYNIAIRLDLSLSQPFCGRAWVYTHLAMPDIGILDATKAIGINPNDAWAYYNRSFAYSDKKDYDKAISDLTEVIRREPKFAMAYYNRGVAYRTKKDYDKAICDFTDAIGLDPKYAWNYHNRGCTYSDKKDYDKAISDFTDAIGLEPKYAWNYYGRGHAYYDKKDYDKAISDFTDAIGLDPKHTWSYYGRGHAYSAKGDHVRARADFAEFERLQK